MDLNIFSKISFTKLTSGLIAAFFMGTAFGGPGSSGGGFAVVCPDTPVEAASVQLLDLYEARFIPDFVLTKTTGSLEEDYFLSAKRTYTLQGAPTLADQRRNEILDNLKKFFRSTEFVHSENSLPGVNDLGQLPYIPPMCRVQQLAFFDDTVGKIYVLKSLWDKMDPLNQAALIQHELFYTHLRSFKDQTSVLARRAVAHIFAVRGPLDIKDGLTNQSLGFYASKPQLAGGTSEVSEFYVTPLFSVSGPLVRLQFSHLQGRPVLAKTWIDMPSWPQNLQIGRAETDLNFIGCIVKDPDQNVAIEVPVFGTMMPELSVRVSYKTNEPIKIALVNRGVILSEGYVSGMNQCKGSRQ